MENVFYQMLFITEMFWLLSPSSRLQDYKESKQTVESIGKPLSVTKHVLELPTWSLIVSLLTAKIW